MTIEEITKRMAADKIFELPKSSALVACAGGILSLVMAMWAAAAEQQPSFTQAQAAAGKAIYAAQCERCHGSALDGGQFGPALKGAQFTANWQGKKISEYFTRVSTSMPPGAAGSIDARSYAAVVAFVLQANGLPSGSTPLAPDVATLGDATLPASSPIMANESSPPAATQARAAARPPTESGSGTSGIELPNFASVTDAMLRSPPAENWSIWRRTYDSQGYSPLRQINDRNVGSLQSSWTWAMATGSMQATPIVHDGVLFIQSGTDTVQALDAASGDLLWSYVRSSPPEAANASRGLASVKRNMAIGGTTLFVATVDAHVIAIDARSGRLLWDQPVADASARWYLSSGPLYVNGKVIQGISGTIARQPGGAAIVALEAATGKQLWRFNTIPQPGEPGVDTWNGAPPERRSGASVWIAGSYDPELNLVFFGAGNTYDTMLHRAKSSPDANNDLLYTNATLALNPDSGKLVWYFQHMPNDLLDLDWAFERSVITLDNRKLVLTGGKIAIFDALDAATGKYAFSRDLGLQNLVSQIDAATGAKTLNPATFANNRPTGVVCPGALGARNWTATSINPANMVMFVPMDEACGEGMRTVARPGGDDKFGQLAAIDLKTGKILWRDRTRATQTSAALATGGNLVFNATYDRWFRANDARTGKELWKARLADVANAFPITYVARGKQYVAIASGGLKPTIGIRGAMTPEIRNPSTSGPVLWAFGLKRDEQTTE